MLALSARTRLAHGGRLQAVIQQGRTRPDVLFAT